MTSTRTGQTAAYMRCYAAQLGAIGRVGQRRLQNASVLIVGAGGLGTSIAVTLASAGVGKLVVIDPQEFQIENINRAAYARISDIGRPKVDVLTAFLDGRPHLTVVPIVGRGEALDTFSESHSADLIISSSNTLVSRRAVAAFASARAIPHVSAAVTDGRRGFGGFVVTWIPNSDLACPACFLTSRAGLPRGEALLAPVVAAVGSVAACLAARTLVASKRRRLLKAGNCVTLDLDRYTIDHLRVLRNPDCTACGPGVSYRIHG